jgi:hypothetical protein
MGRANQELTSKWIDGYEDTADVCVNLATEPSLLQIIIDGLVANGCQKSHVRHSCCLLLEPFLPVGLLEVKSASESDQ